jgi:prepilin signal peptidase PulO-like enzyme (type II secretory pathway)
MSIFIYVAVSIIATSCGAFAVVSARRRIHVLRVTGETFSHHDVALSRSAAVISCTVVAAASMMLVSQLGVSLALAGYMIAVTGFVYLALIDIDTHLLPWADCLTVGFLAGALLSTDALIQHRGDIVATMVVSAIVTWVIFRFLEWLSRGDLGGGDVMLASVLAAVLGYFGTAAVIQAIVVAIVSAGAFALVAITVTRFHARSAFAFGPFLLVGALIAMMSADPLWVATH